MTYSPPQIDHYVCHITQLIPENSETGVQLKLYQILKASPSVEQYIEARISLNKGRVITQLRTGCLPLEVELGHYRSPKTPLADRQRQLCKSGIGDEPHLLLDCSVLSEYTAQLQHMMTRKVEQWRRKMLGDRGH